MLWMALGWLSLASPPPARAALAPSIEVDRVEGSKLLFKALPGTETPKPVDTGLQDLKVLATLPVESDPARPNSGIGTQATPSSAPWILTLAKPCRDCSSDERDLFVIRPTTGEMHQINHPGRIIDPKSGALVHESRAFYGQCVDGRKAGVFVFQREKVDRKKQLASSFYSAEAGATLLEEALLERHFPSLKRTLQKTKLGLCTEIPGRNRVISGRVFDVQGMKPIDIASGAGASVDEDDEDENDPNLRRATVGSEDSEDKAVAEEDSEDDVPAVEAGVKPMTKGEGARVASPQASAQELKNRITSPLNKTTATGKKSNQRQL